MVSRRPGSIHALAIALVLLVPGLALACPPLSADSLVRPAGSARAARPKPDALRVPFVANDGRHDPRVAYYVPTPGSTFFVTRHGELVYSLRERRAADKGVADTPAARAERRRRIRGPGRGWSLTESFVGGQTRPVGQDRAAATVSRFHGGDAAGWRTAAPTYQSLDLGEVWPGIAVSLGARGGRIEKIFTVAPGASVDQIRLNVRGARSLSIDAAGALVAETGLGDVAFTPPVAYQEGHGGRDPVSVAYRLDGRQYGFALGAYDRTRPLVIDPLLQSTFLGGNDDEIAYAIAIHPTTGDVYVAGDTYSENFPGTLGGAQPLLELFLEGWIARLDRTLTVLLGATYFGGDGDDSVFALALHPTPARCTRRAAPTPPTCRAS